LGNGPLKNINIGVESEKCRPGRAFLIQTGVAKKLIFLQGVVEINDRFLFFIFLHNHSTIKLANWGDITKKPTGIMIRMDIPYSYFYQQ
jgi:hypothetical protein